MVVLSLNWLYADAKQKSVPEEKDLPIFLTSINTATFARLSDLMAPDDPSIKTYPVVTDLLIKHFKPKRLKAAERFKFHKRHHATGKTISDSFASLVTD